VPYTGAMRICSALALAFTLASAPAWAAPAEVHLAIRNGRVTLTAKDATVSQILAEWARVGQTKIVNAERVPGGPLTLQFTNLPEDQALDILLRAVSGYVAAPRDTPAPTLSHYDRILVLPTAVAARPPASSAPVFSQPAVIRQAPPEDDQDRPGADVIMPARGPIFQTFPQPQVAPQPQSPAPTSSAVPGVILQPPPQTRPQVVVPETIPQNEAPPQAAPFSTTPGTPTTPPVGTSAPGVIVPAPVPPGQAPRVRPSPNN
jgi:hypothetical protein